MKNYFLLFFACFLSFASHGQSAKWLQINATDSSGDQIAGTISNDGKSYLASRCFRDIKKCVIIISAPTKCEKDAEYSMLINSDDGAYHTVGMCRLNGSQYEYILTPYNTLFKIISKDSGIIGFALPLDSGEFRAYRFSLVGAKKALEDMHTKINQSAPRDSYKF
jgi:hypothetical protein